MLQKIWVPCSFQTPKWIYSKSCFCIKTFLGIHRCLKDSESEKKFAKPLSRSFSWRICQHRIFSLGSNIFSKKLRSMGWNGIILGVMLDWVYSVLQEANNWGALEPICLEFKNFFQQFDFLSEDCSFWIWIWS